MNTTLECIPCFVEHALHMAKITTDSDKEQFKILKQCMKIISEVELESTPPEMARKIHRIIKDVTGTEDVYEEIKIKSTELALKLLPSLRSYVEHSDDPFKTIIKLVIAGNIIDFGANRNFKLQEAEQLILETLDHSIDHDAVERLKNLMDNASSILYILDNCGEAVIDRLLIEQYRDKITCVVRGGPILNDITEKEVEISGLKGLVNIITTGDSTPGVSMQYSSPDFLEVFKNCELIIAKGQGNFETLSGVNAPIVFLLRVKCHVVQALLQANKGDLIINFGKGFHNI